MNAAYRTLRLVHCVNENWRISMRQYANSRVYFNLQFVIIFTATAQGFFLNES